MTEAERLDLISEAVFILVQEQLSGHRAGRDNRFQRLQIIANRIGDDLRTRGRGGQVEWILSNLAPTQARLHYGETKP